MNRLEERIRAGLQETAERIPDTAPTATLQRRRSVRPTGAWVAVAAVAAVLILASPILFMDGSGSAPAVDPGNPFSGNWVTTDLQESPLRMEIEVSTDGVVEIVVTDEIASACSGAPSTMVGVGRFEGDTVLVIPAPVLTCDDGSQSEMPGVSFTLDPGSDTLTDTLGSVWTRQLASPEPTTPQPTTPPPGAGSPIRGEWGNDQGDDTTHTVTIEASGAGRAEMHMEDDFAAVCSGAPFHVTGTGSFQSDDTLVFPSPTLICKDGSQPEAVSGPPLEEQFQNLTFTHDPRSDTLTDSLGLVWTRGIPNTPGINWPQTSLEEVQAAQELAGAGDPDYTWQLEPNMESILQAEGQVDTPEIIARFLRKELGWVASTLLEGSPETMEYGGFEVVLVDLIRCEPGKSNPVWPNDPRIGGCAPTIDDLHYENASVGMTQPHQKGPDGIWVASFVSDVYPFEQAPAIDIAEMMEAFLQARISGRGAEQYLGQVNSSHVEIGYLYATSTGAPYERAEFEIEDGEILDLGPFAGAVGLRVRLFADGGQTVVEQTLTIEQDMRSGGVWALFQHDDDLNTENGVPLP